MADLTVTFASVSIPSNTSVTLTVEEDPDTDGTFENSNSTGLTDGQTEYTLSGFDGSGDVKVTLEPDNTDDVSAATVGEPVDVSTTSVTATADVASGSGDALDAGATGSGTATATADVASGSGQALDAGAGTFSSFITALPDAAGLSLDASVEDEITASWTDTIDNGDYRIQVRESGEGQAYGDEYETTVGEATTSHTIPSLEDGERYDVRLRTETEHLTGAWIAETATTVLPAPSNLSTANATATEWDVTWTDNADNEDDYLVERRREYSGGFGPWQTLATLAADSTSYTDSTVQPDTKYEYRITARTEHTTSATTLTDTTPGLGYGTRRVSPSGWTVEIDRADTGATRRPAIVGTPRYDPSLNSLPRVELPVAKDESWNESQWEDAPIRVWREGVRLPIEQVRSVEQQPGETVIEAIGGTELLEPQSHEFDTDIHTAANTVIDETSYAKVVDSPSVTGGESLQVIDSPEEFRDLYEDPGPQFPVMIDDTGDVPSETGIQLAQTCFLAEGEANTTDSTNSNDYPGSLPNWSDDEAAALPTDDNEVTFTFTLDHEIPAGEVGFEIHRTAYEFRGIVTAKIDGQTTEQLDLTSQDSTFDDTTWVSKNTGANGTEYTSTLSEGEHTVEISVSSVTSGDFYVDAVAVFDQRYHNADNFDELSGGDSYFDSPALYPTSGTDAKLLYQGFQSASGATFDNSTWNDTSGDQAIALSNDGGSNYITCSNCTTLDADFNQSSADILIRLTLDAWGDRDAPTERASPLFDYKTQTLREFELFGDIRDSGPLRNDVFEAAGRDILTKLVNRGNALWAVTWDDTNGITVEFTNAGQRSAGRTLDLVDYTWSKETLDRQITWAKIKGGAQRVQGESITADAGNAVALNHDNLIPGREQVSNSDRTQIYTRGVDYEMEYLLGNVRATTTGDISDGETLTVDYEWKPKGEFARETDEKKQLVRTFVGASTDTTCKSIAYYLTEELENPVRSGEAVIDDLPPGVSVLDALAFDPIPDTDDYHVEKIDRRPGEVRLTLASRIRVQDAVSNISSRLGDHGDRI